MNRYRHQNSCILQRIFKTKNVILVFITIFKDLKITENSGMPEKARVQVIESSCLIVLAADSCNKNLRLAQFITCISTQTINLSGLVKTPISSAGCA